MASTRIRCIILSMGCPEEGPLYLASSCQAWIFGNEIEMMAGLKLCYATIGKDPMLFWQNSPISKPFPMLHEAVLNKQHIMIFVVTDPKMALLYNP